MENNALNSQVLLQGSRYRLTRTLGQGGFGITYEGVQTGLNRKVAIKEFFMRDFCSRQGGTSVTITSPDKTKLVSTGKEKFLKEARMIADLQHTNIIKIIDVFSENNTAYYVMEHIGGGALQDIVNREGPMSETRALKIIRQVADALDYLHQRNILHLDVKPANIMMRNENTAVLIDFGISKHYSDNGSQTTTSAGFISRGYAPMEQYNEGGVATFSPAADIYSLGATLFYMLTGNRPPEAQIIIEKGLPALPKGISQATRKAITAAMLPARTKRPQSISEFIKMLDDGETMVNDDTTQTLSDINQNHREAQKEKKEEVKKHSKAFSFGKLLAVVFFVGIVYILGWGVLKNRTNPSETASMPRQQAAAGSYVDLGLPSGTLWADRNVGANSPEEFGDYFAWGETMPKSRYNWSTYKYCKGSDETLTKYCFFNRFSRNGFTDDLPELLPEDDAATANWGTGWRMPTIDQMNELVDSSYTTAVWMTLNGVYGSKITSKSNGNSLFFPAAGSFNESSLKYVGSNGSYWSRSLYLDGSEKARCLGFNSRSIRTDYLGDRCLGSNIRPVLIQN